MVRFLEMLRRRLGLGARHTSILSQALLEKLAQPGDTNWDEFFRLEPKRSVICLVRFHHDVGPDLGHITRPVFEALREEGYKIGSIIYPIALFVGDACPSRHHLEEILADFPNVSALSGQIDSFVGVVGTKVSFQTSHLSPQMVEHVTTALALAPGKFAQI